MLYKSNRNDVVYMPFVMLAGMGDTVNAMVYRIGERDDDTRLSEFA